MSKLCETPFGWRRCGLVGGSLCSHSQCKTVQRTKPFFESDSGHDHADASGPGLSKALSEHRRIAEILPPNAFSRPTGFEPVPARLSGSLSTGGGGVVGRDRIEQSKSSDTRFTVWLRSQSPPTHEYPQVDSNHRPRFRRPVSFSTGPCGLEGFEVDHTRERYLTRLSVAKGIKQ
jgi:hypothetical protein